MAKDKAKPRDNAIIRYLRETWVETAKKTRWPTRQESWNLTKIVLGVTISMALLLGLLDYLFSIELTGIINQNWIAIGVAGVAVVATIVAVVILKRQAA